MDGIYKEIQKRFGVSVENYIMASRCAQGFTEYSRSTSEEREQILKKWETVQGEVVKRKTRHSGRELRETGKKLSAEERERREAEKAAERANRRQAFRELSRGRQKYRSDIQAEDEEAIQHSVHVTSRGNPAEDEMIERALRASLAELRAAEAAGEEEQRAIDRAIDASIREAQHVLMERGAAEPLAPVSKEGGSSSLGNEKQDSSLPPRPELPPRNTGPVTPAGDDGSNDADLEHALAQSRQTYEEEAKMRAQQEKSDMDIVMEYIKKQSLAELEYASERQR